MMFERVRVVVYTGIDVSPEAESAFEVKGKITYSEYPSAEDRLPKSLHFAESDVIIGVVRARSVHKVCYGHNCDEAA